jgi:hypothetical protein
MCSGFSTTGASDGPARTDQAECGGVEEVILSAVEQWTVGPNRGLIRIVAIRLVWITKNER